VTAQDCEDALVAGLRRLAPSLDGEPDPDFRAATRARLVAMAAVRTPAPAPASGLQRLLAARAPARWRPRVTAGLAGAALTVTALAALVAVADGAAPGDVLYDLKRGTEQTQLALAGDSRGWTLLGFASTRLDELETLVGDGATALPAATPAEPDAGTLSAAGPDPGLVLETLRTMDEQTQQGAVWLTERAIATEDAGPLDDLAEWAAGQAGGLSALESLVPDAAADAFGQSLRLLAEVDARTGGLEATLACPGGPAVDGSDDLGPVPAPCPAPEATPPATTEGGTTDLGTGAVPGMTTPEGPLRRAPARNYRRFPRARARARVAAAPADCRRRPLPRRHMAAWVPRCRCPRRAAARAGRAAAPRRSFRCRPWAPSRCALHRW
jgi:hypothetical protein